MFEIVPDGEKEILGILSSIFPSSMVLNLCLALEFSSEVQSTAFGASFKLEVKAALKFTIQPDSPALWR